MKAPTLLPPSQRAVPFCANVSESPDCADSSSCAGYTFHACSMRAAGILCVCVYVPMSDIQVLPRSSVNCAVCRSVIVSASCCDFGILQGFMGPERLLILCRVPSFMI